MTNHEPCKGLSQDTDALIAERQAAGLLGLTPSALQAWRQRGGGPPYVRISSRCVRYKRSDLRRWVDERVESS